MINSTPWNKGQNASISDELVQLCTCKDVFHPLYCRHGAASKESYHEDTYPNILHRYLKFDDEMSVISVVWRDCQQLLETYNDEQVGF